MTKLQSFFYSIICDILLFLVTESISPFIGDLSIFLSLSLILITNLFSLLCFFYQSFLLLFIFHFRDYLAIILNVTGGRLYFLVLFFSLLPGSSSGLQKNCTFPKVYSF